MFQKCTRGLPQSFMFATANIPQEFSTFFGWGVSQLCRNPTEVFGSLLLGTCSGNSWGPAIERATIVSNMRCPRELAQECVAHAIQVLTDLDPVNKATHSCRLCSPWAAWRVPESHLEVAQVGQRSNPQSASGGQCQATTLPLSRRCSDQGGPFECSIHVLPHISFVSD